MAQTPHHARQALARALPNLRPNPSYFHGLEPTGWLPPRNILLFTRLHQNALKGGSAATPQHHRFVLMTSLETAGTICVDDRQIRLQPGEALLVFPFQIHFYADLERPALAWLFVTFETAEPDRWEALRFQPLRLDHADYHRLEALQHDWQQRQPGIGFSLGRLLTGLLAKTGAHTHGQRSTGRETFERINQILHQLPDQPHSIESLAGQLGISPGHLRARFRAECGMSLGRFLQLSRLNRAAALLVHTHQRIGEIAEATGYASLFAFSRAFRERMGMSPTDYRAQMAGK